jgi:AraC-like DNA-binding protein
MEERLSLMKNIIRNFGVRMLVYEETLSGLADYDGGFRSRLFRIHDTRRLEEFLRAAEPAVLYLVTDPYGYHYGFFRLDKSRDALGSWYCSIGPWVETLPEDTDITGILDKNRIPHHLKPEAVQYFTSLPLITFRGSWEGMLLTIADYLCADENKFRILYRKFDLDDSASEYSPRQDSVLSMRLIEELYKNEDALLDAIKAGDTKRALLGVANLSYYHTPKRTDEKIRNVKDYMLTLNTLARKTVQSSTVHPIHIHAVSTGFVQRIEAAKYAELGSIFEAMIRSYCALVQTHSLGKFSLVVRNVINFVEFNLKEPLTLSLLARQFNIGASNLSHHITREMGMTLTEYVNRKRLEYARFLLGSSGMYIHEIAEECGFQDDNYFIRLFKREYGKTPRDYQKSLHEGI